MEQPNVKDNSLKGILEKIDKIEIDLKNTKSVETFLYHSTVENKKSLDNHEEMIRNLLSNQDSIPILQKVVDNNRMAVESTFKQHSREAKEKEVKLEKKINTCQQDYQELKEIQNQIVLTVQNSKQEYKEILEAVISSLKRDLINSIKEETKILQEELQVEMGKVEEKLSKQNEANIAGINEVKREINEVKSEINEIKSEIIEVKSEQKELKNEVKEVHAKLCSIEVGLSCLL